MGGAEKGGASLGGRLRGEHLGPAGKGELLLVDVRVEWAELGCQLNVNGI